MSWPQSSPTSVWCLLQLGASPVGVGLVGGVVEQDLLPQRELLVGSELADERDELLLERVMLLHACHDLVVRRGDGEEPVGLLESQLMQGLEVPVGRSTLSQKALAPLVEGVQTRGLDAEGVERCLELAALHGALLRLLVDDSEALDEDVRISGHDAEQPPELGVQIGERGEALVEAELTQLRHALRDHGGEGLGVDGGTWQGATPSVGDGLWMYASSEYACAHSTMNVC